MENQETFWVVWREGDRNPVVKHENFEKADMEAIRLSKENPGSRFFILSSVNVMRYVEPDPIKQVWEKYKHMDALLCDKIWLDSYISPQRKCLFDCWQAIRESQEGKEKL